MEVLQKINALDAKARKALASPALALAAPGAKDAILDMLEIVRGLAVETAHLRGRLAVFEKLKGGSDGGEKDRL